MRSDLFDGELDSPLPKSAVMIMKYFFGLRVLSSPMSQTLSDISVGLPISSCFNWRLHEVPTSRIPTWIDNSW